jgi:tyrosyl-tRNA synthetase
MLSKDSVQSRMETGLSFTEFSYQLLQGYDFQWLYKNKNCRLQLGGSDQWGNITAGTELIRRMGGAQDAFAVTTPLITKSDGSKFGKSEDGNIWLDPALTSPYQFFQFFLNVSDDEALPLLKRFTFLNKEKIEQLNTEHLVDPSARILQKALAEEVTKLVHKEEGLITAKLTTDVLFGKGTLSDLENISEAQFESVLSGVPRGIIQKEEFETDWINVLSNGSQNLIFPSKSEAKKMIQAGAVVINKVKISEPAISEYNLLRGKFLLIQKGKKNYFLLEYVQ